jgi:endonuclease/exonuclease/phosphatase family metal-dependent hydrolase
MRSGSYRGTAEGLDFDIRVEVNASGDAVAASGDVSQNGRFLASFFCDAPRRNGGTVEGTVVFRGNPGLQTGSIRLDVDDRGIGAFQLGVDMESGFRDLFAGRLEWQGSFLRRLTVEIDGLRGLPLATSFVDHLGRTVSIQTAFERAGFDLDLVVDPFFGRGSRVTRARGFSLAEIHVAMQQRRSQQTSGRMHAHVFVCSFLAGRNNAGVLGIMYDFDEADINRRPREGVAVFAHHPLLSDPRVPEAIRNREMVFTIVHEVGHALNLLHSFDKGRPSALSWMNYPQLYPLGQEAPSDHDGTDEFWRLFGESFDEQDLRHLRHATPREIVAGGFPFGVYEEGPSFIYEGGAAEPRRTRLGANPLRQSPDVFLRVAPLKRDYFLGEPVFLHLEAANTGPYPVRVPDALDPSEGCVRLSIRRPNGKVVRYRPPVRLCKQAQLVPLDSNPGLAPAQLLRSHAIPAFLSAEGPVFTEPGVYQVSAELAGIDGARTAFSEPVKLTVHAPDRETARFAEKLWNTPGAMRALYLRHPLVDIDSWHAVEEEARKQKLAAKAGNTTASYLEYIAALGWMYPFARPDGRELPEQLSSAVARIKKVDPAGLPEAVAERKQRLLAKDGAVTSRAGVVVTRAAERVRSEIPPSGLFGAIGLDLPDRSPDAAISPFAIVVKKLKDNPAFADVVSWNIEHLHGEGSFHRIPRVAEFMRGFRCDFWGLQEVDETAVKRLVDTINSSGNLRYQFLTVPGKGQQSGCLFRTDTARVEMLDSPSGFFENEITVELAGNKGKSKRKVFLRDPLLCDVRVRQSAGKVFDFRCAIVHLKSTDTKLKDTGNSLRAAAAKELARWIAQDRKSGVEKDYLVMGDMNAETAAQGLEPFSKTNKLRLLSVGMKAKHGTEGDNAAITRFASGRLLDHIVITADAAPFMPQSDKKEQIIVRADVSVPGFKDIDEKNPKVHTLSDHVPVAVRFILGPDKD